MPQRLDSRFREGSARGHALHNKLLCQHYYAGTRIGNYDMMNLLRQLLWPYCWLFGCRDPLPLPMDLILCLVFNPACQRLVAASQKPEYSLALDWACLTARKQIPKARARVNGIMAAPTQRHQIFRRDIEQRAVTQMMNVYLRDRAIAAPIAPFPDSFAAKFSPVVRF